MEKKSKKTEDKSGVYLIGLLLCIFGLYEMIVGNIAIEFVVLGMGISFIASVDKRLRKK